jgi:hypothetical protein
VWVCFSGSVRDLGAGDYQVRERAEARLHRHAWLAWRLCDRPCVCPERRRRARQVVERYLRCTDGDLPVIVALCRQPVPEWQRGREYTRHPPPETGWEFAWCHPGPRGSLAGVVRGYLERARYTTHPWPGWYTVGEAREATRLLVADLLRAGVPAPVVRALLAGMAGRESSWQARAR